MTSELKLFGDLLFLLWAAHERPWAYKNGEAREIYQQISDLYPPFGRREELRAFLPSHDRPATDFALTKKFLYLNPPEGQPTFVPVLSLRCDFTSLLPEIRLRVGLFLREHGEVKSVGLRFESPEGEPEGEGVHHYYHAQFISSFYAGAPLKGVMSWLPVTQPALTLNADGPVGLLLSLLVSLYGLDHLASVVVAFTGDLRTYAAEFMPDYWLVRVGGNDLKYKTWKSADRFNTRIRERHRGGNIELSDAATYQTDDGHERRID